MNLDEMKSIWKKEPISAEFEISLEKKSEIHSPLEKIRANMQKEFWYSLISMFGVGLALFFTTSLSQLVIFGALYFVALMITAYYFSRFYQLYKRINTQNFSALHNLLNLRYELILNTELYKSYNISFVPLALGFYWVLLQANFSDNENEIMMIFIAQTVTFMLMMYYFGRLWLREMYGKYIVKISDLIMQMTDGVDDFQYDRAFLNSKENNKWHNKTNRFFTRKLGKLGSVVNFIFWIFLLIAAFALAGSIVGFTLYFIRN